jgi:hypothetical protein
MRIAKWIIIGLVVVVLGSVLHYTLPRHDVVRIVGVETRLETFGINRFFYASVPAGMADAESRDVRYVETLRPDGRERIFRNEDTGWGWPPYFKMNSADMQARARDMVSTSDDPRWVRITYYGVRSRMFSIYPNAIRLRPAEGPEESVFPWTRTIGLIGLAVLAFWLWRLLRRFRRRRVEPFVEDVSARGRAARGWLRRTWDRLRGRG